MEDAEIQHGDIKWQSLESEKPDYKLCALDFVARTGLNASAEESVKSAEIIYQWLIKK